MNRRRIDIAWNLLSLPVTQLSAAAIGLLVFPSLDAIAQMELRCPFIMQIFHQDAAYEGVMLPGNASNQY